VGPELVADRLIAFAKKLRGEGYGPTGADLEPDGPTMRPLVVFLLRDPGETEASAANKTGLLAGAVIELSFLEQVLRGAPMSCDDRCGDADERRDA
jgi:hypothetical protein